VQYRESDLDFVSRLLEEEGILYYFEHEKGAHTLVLTDLTDGFKSAGKARFAAGSEGPAHEGVVLELEAETAVHTGKVTLRDYDYLKPTTSLESKTGSKPWEYYDYPGRYTEKDQGERLARIRLETAEAQEKLVRGGSTFPGFRPGRKFSLAEHYRKDLNAEYALLEVRTTAIGGDYTAWDEGGFDYRNYFVAIPAKTAYHPSRHTPKPRVEGAQTAMVVGAPGEEIWVDKYGRVKVQFHWDREGGKDDNSSCWVRVATTWAGKNWGAIEIPRIGEEVIVDFLEGDPDQPIITGRVYNGDRLPPFKLPDNKTQSGVLTRSSKAGSGSNANELRFEDKKGAEEILLHAEKDCRVEVENNRDTTIGNDDTRVVEKGNDSHTIKKGKQTITVFGDQTITIDQGNQSLTLKMGNQGTVVKMGNVDTDVKLGKHSTKAMQSIELTVGQSSIKVDQTGVTIKGMMIKIEGQTITQIKGLMTKVEGSAMLTAKGGITMIN
jgi:type VI secretion system secreted protein VgrG